MKRIAIITGASRGIGLAIARHLYQNGYSVALLARNLDQLKEVKKSLPKSKTAKSIAIKCDVTHKKSVEAAIHTVIQDLGTPTVLVNNAGLGGPFHRTDEVTDEEWEEIFNTNIRSVFYFSRIILPLMKKEKHGRIINISSILGTLGGARSSTYAATKHAMIGYTKSIAAEWAQFGITCNAICPGYVITDLITKFPKDQQLKLKQIQKRIPTHQFTTPLEIARLVSLLADENSISFNGGIYTVDSGLTCHSDPYI